MDIKVTLPLLPLRDIVVFPSMVIPLFVGRDKSITALNEVMKGDKKIVLVTQKNSEVDDPKKNDVFSYGCESNILQLLKLPDGTVKVLVEGIKRVKLVDFKDNEKFISCTFEYQKDILVIDEDLLPLALTAVRRLEKLTSINKKVSTETINNIKQVIQVAKKKNIPVLIDGAQAPGHIKIDVQKLDCDFYCFSGHKLYGPTGIGILFGKYNLLDKMPPFLGGGDMIDIVKIQKSTYADPPLRFEAGTPPIVEAIALGEAIDWVNEIGIEEIGRHEKNIIDYGTSLLDSIDGVSVFGKAPNKTGVVSFTMDCAHPHDIATIIDREGIAVRAGHHCAQPLLETLNETSTARISFYIYNNFSDIDKLVDSINSTIKYF